MQRCTSSRGWMETPFLNGICGEAGRGGAHGASGWGRAESTGPRRRAAVGAGCLREDRVEAREDVLAADHARAEEGERGDRLEHDDERVGVALGEGREQHLQHESKLPM